MSVVFVGCGGARCGWGCAISLPDRHTHTHRGQLWWHHPDI